MQTQAVKFNFKTTKTEEGADFKRPSLEAALPSLQIEDILAIIETGGKGLELLLSTVNDVMTSRAKELISEAIEETPAIELTQAFIDSKANELLWDTIANIPAGKRGGSAGIAKETWAAFEVDYIEVMGALHPERAAERTKLAAKYLRTKFASIKSDKKGITLLQTFLGEYFASTSKAEDFAEVFASINTRAEELLNAEASAIDSIA
jgi:hypothetical protein